MPEAKRKVVRDVDTEKRLRRAVLPEAECKVARSIDTQRKPLKRATLTKIELKIARNIEAQRKCYNIEEGPILPIADRNLVCIARRPIINSIVQRYSLGNKCFTCPNYNAVFFDPNKQAAQSPRLSF